MPEWVMASITSPAHGAQQEWSKTRRSPLGGSISKRVIDGRSYRCLPQAASAVHSGAAFGARVILRLGPVADADRLPSVGPSGRSSMLAVYSECEIWELG